MFRLLADLSVALISSISLYQYQPVDMVPAMLYHCCGYDGNSFGVKFRLSLLYRVANDALPCKTLQTGPKSIVVATSFPPTRKSQGTGDRNQLSASLFKRMIAAALNITQRFLELDTQLSILSSQIRPSAETLQKRRWSPTQSHRWKCVSLFM